MAASDNQDNILDYAGAFKLKACNIISYRRANNSEKAVRQNILPQVLAITLVESSNKEHQKTAQELLKEIFNLTGNSVRVGITGPPGAGKSTFIEALGMFLIKNNLKVAVLAVDPSSSLSKGSILGDKTRM